MSFIAISVIGFFSSGTAKICMIFAFFTFSIIFTAMIFISKTLKNEAICLSIISCLSLLAAIISFAYFDIYYNNSMSLLDKEECQIQATVLSEDTYYADTHIYSIRVDKVDGKAMNFKAVFESTDQQLLETGNKISVVVTPEAFEDSAGTYSEKFDRLSSGFFMKFESTGRDKLIVDGHKNPNWLSVIIVSLRSAIFDKFTNLVGKEESGLPLALFLGDRSMLSDEIKRDFSRAGAYHLLALSGMHMTIIVGFFEFLLKQLYVVLKVRVIALSVFALSYLALTGFSISAIRAVLMLLAVYLSGICELPADPLTTLSMAGFFMLALSPTTVVDAGFWMSFGATFGILAFADIFKGMFSGLYKWGWKTQIPVEPITYLPTTAFAGICAMIPMTLILCIFIKEFSYMTVLSTVLLSLPTTLLLILCLIFTFLPSIPFITTSLTFSINHISDLMARLCARISDIEHITVSLNYPQIKIAIVILSLTLVFSLSFNFKKKKWLSLIPVMCATAILLSTIAISENLNSEKVKVTYLSTSSNSEFVILSCNREVVICDFSNGSNSSRNSETAIMSELHATEIDGVVITDYSSRLAVSTSRLFASEKVRRVWLPMPTNYDDYHTMRSMVESAERYGVDAYVYNYGDTITVFESVELYTLRSEIDRSAVPVFLLNIKTENEQLTYLSEAYGESELRTQANEIITTSDYILFGTKGPVSKMVYSLPDGCNELKQVVFADRAVAGYLKSDSLPQDVRIVVNAEKYDLTLQKP